MSGVGTRHEMEEIRGNTAELDKQTGFVLSGIRNEGERNCGIAWSMVIDPTIACLGKLPLACSQARSLVRSPVCAEIGNLLVRDRHSRLLTSVAGSMG